MVDHAHLKIKGLGMVGSSVKEKRTPRQGLEMQFTFRMTEPEKGGCIKYSVNILFAMGAKSIEKIAFIF